MLLIYTTRGQNAPTQRPLLEPNALEFDQHGKEVPATLQHIYRWFFRHQNVLEEASDKLLSKGITTGSVRQNLRFELQMTEDEFAVFESAALRYGKKEKEIKARIAAATKADWARHPNTPAVSPKGRTAVAALLAEQDEALNSELATMKAALSPASAADLDRRVVHVYATGFRANLEKVKKPGAPAPTTKPQPDGTPHGPAVDPADDAYEEAVEEPVQDPSPTPTPCVKCQTPNVSNLTLEFSPDGSTVVGSADLSIPDEDAQGGCVATGSLSLDNSGTTVASDTVDATNPSVTISSDAIPITVGSHYAASLSVIPGSCVPGQPDSCSNPVIATRPGFQTGPPSITGVSPPTITLGQSGTITLSGTDLGGPPAGSGPGGNSALPPSITLTSGSGLDLQVNFPTRYDGTGNATGTQNVDYTVGQDASFGPHFFQLSTVWGSTNGSVTVVCTTPTILNVTPQPWQNGQFPITVTGFDFCPGSTLTVTIPQGTISASNVQVGSDNQTITATITLSNVTGPETANLTVTNMVGPATIGVPVVGSGPPPPPAPQLYFIDPYLLPGYQSGVIPESTVLGTLPTNGADARGLIHDGTATAIVVLPVPANTISVDFVLTNLSDGSLAPYSSDFLTKQPTGARFVNATPIAFQGNSYAMALVQAPFSPTGGSIQVTAIRFGAPDVVGQIPIVRPFVVLSHGLWGGLTALENVRTYLKNNGYAENMMLKICYSSFEHWDAPPNGATDCANATGVTAIGNALTDPAIGAYRQYDVAHIVGGRVDYIGHSMGGLIIRAFGAQPGYLTNVRDRYQGAIHTFISIDTPAQGSLEADYLLANAQCTAQSGASLLERTILSKAGCDSTMTVQRCFSAAGMPLSASATDVTKGAVYSLKPSYIQAVPYPGKPPGSNWFAINANFGDPGFPFQSVLRNVLQDLIGNFYGPDNNPTGAPCNVLTGDEPPTLSEVLTCGVQRCAPGTTFLPNDVIVTVPSQSAGFSQLPDGVAPMSGNLEHTSTPGINRFIPPLLGMSDSNVLQPTGFSADRVNSTILTYLTLPIVSPLTATLNPGDQQQFTATSAVTWSIDPPNLGSITSAGLYSAPPPPLDTQQTVTVSAACANNASTPCGTAVITLMPTADFSITTTQPATTVTPGVAVSYPITISPINGFTGVVNLSVSAAPSAIAPTISPTSVTIGSSPVNATVTVPGTSAVNNYAITVTGTPPSLSFSHTLALTLDVVDFTISASPSTVTVSGGGTANYTVSTASAGPNGFSLPVCLSVSGQPAGVTPSFTPACITGAGNSTLSLPISNTTSPGNYSLTVTGTTTAGGGTDTQTASPAPVLTVVPSISSISPGSGTAGTSVTITGTNFGSSPSVTFNGIAATPTAFSNTSITVPVPTGPQPGPGTLLVVANGVSSNSVAFSVVPGITTINPTYGPVGAAVTITGTSFSNTPGTLTFNGTAATVSTWSNATLNTTVPVGSTTGNVVVTAGGTSSSGTQFIVTSPQTFYLTPTSSATNGWMTLSATTGSAASFASSNLSNQPAGAYLIQAFNTSSGVPNSSNTWPAGLAGTFTVWMKQTAGTPGTLFPEVQLYLNGPSGTAICTAIGSTALTTTNTQYNLSCAPTQNIPLTPSAQYYLWVGLNSTQPSSSSLSAQLGVGMQARGAVQSNVTVPIH